MMYTSRASGGSTDEWTIWWDRNLAAARIVEVRAAISPRFTSLTEPQTRLFWG